MITAVGVTVSTANGAVRNVIKLLGRPDDCILCTRCAVAPSHVCSVPSSFRQTDDAWCSGHNGP